MSKKHFEFMAKYARNIKDRAERQVVIEAFVVVCQQYNSKFDVERFRTACEPN